MKLDRFNRPEIEERDDCTIIYESDPGYGFIPVLCFHRIGNYGRFYLSKENFISLMQLLNTLKYYPISDHDLINHDFASVPDSWSPIVLGADDAADMNFTVLSSGDLKNGDVIYDSRGAFFIDPECLVGMIQRYLAPENGRYPFTFYISQDGIPFRQTGGNTREGIDWRDNPLVIKKIEYLKKFFYLGTHSFHHYPSFHLSESELIEEFKLSLSWMEDILGDTSRLITIAYPNGLGEFQKPVSDDFVRALKEMGIQGAFDFDGYFAKPDQLNRKGLFQISRLGVDNYNYESVVDFLQSLTSWKNHRIIIQKSDELETIGKLSESDRIGYLDKGKYCEKKNNQS